MSSLFDLTGRTAAVTGAGRGIGRGLALALAAAGADLILVGRAASQAGTRDDIADLGRKADIVEVDLADRGATHAAGAELAAAGGVDILVNNAGVIDRASVLDVTTEAWDRVLDVNLNAVFELSRLLAAPMAARGAGKIVNVASLLSFQGGLRVASYTAAKHAVAGLTRAMANELAPRNVQVNAIAPGYIETDNTQALREDPQRYRAISDRIPAGRWGTPDDLAGAVVFLSSRAADYVNGHILVVDGGWLAR
ncbi:SDR family oxidoreductase [Dactylosporangium sp. CA-139066]|uniref:SDR family oxidoreductase n=1 Tax=Dactylosporangium sp. CA-139066 TaxID=3239930 RepID=UPI003D93D2DA